MFEAYLKVASGRFLYINFLRNKMIRQRGIGLFLIILGGLIALMNASITGAVIGTGIKSYFFIFSFVFFMAGLLFFLQQEFHEYRVRPLENILEEAGREGFTTFVIDTSGALDYHYNIDKLADRFPGKVYLPKRAMEELSRGQRGQKILQNLRDAKGKSRVRSLGPKSEGVDPADFRGAQEMAIDYLGKTKKFKTYLAVKPYFEGKKIDEPDEFWRKYERVIGDARFTARKALGTRAEPTDRQILPFLKKQFGVSKADVELLTTAIYQAYLGKTEIIACDSHIKEAVDMLKKDDKKLGQNLKYVEYRKYAA